MHPPAVTTAEAASFPTNFSLPRGGVNAARAALRSRLRHAVWCHSIDYCEQGIDGAAQHGAERRVAFNAVRRPIRRIIGQYGDAARAALCAFERDCSIVARDQLVVL